MSGGSNGIFLIYNENKSDEIKPLLPSVLFYLCLNSVRESFTKRIPEKSFLILGLGDRTNVSHQGVYGAFIAGSCYVSEAGTRQTWISI